jgi:CRP-like cAMP-binding protein
MERDVRSSEANGEWSARAIAESGANGVCDSDRIVDWLRASRFCDGVEDEDLHEIAQVVKARTFGAGETLALAGEDVKDFIILAEGIVKSTFRDLKGHEHVLGYINPGDHAGDVALLERSPRPVTFVAMSPGTLLEISAPAFHRLVDRHGRLLRNLFRMLRRYLHDWRLEQLAIPAFATTVDLVTARDVVRDRGDAVHAILESINLPGIAGPIMRDGMALVDGGVLNNLPADVLADRGADFVVGVDVSSRLKPEFAGIGPDRTSRPRRAGTLETLFRVFEAQAHGLGNVRNRAVDFWVTPDTGPFDFTDFTRAAELAAAGADAARDSLPRLQRQLAEFEKRLTTATAV